MAYKLEYSRPDYHKVLRDSVLEWSKAENDVFIVSQEGHKIFTHKIILKFYSRSLGEVMDSLPSPSTSTISGISISASSSSISSLLHILTTGKAASNNKETLVNVKEAAKALGINLGNCLLESRESNARTKKVPVEFELKRSIDKDVDTEVSPANLAVFKNRKEGMDGIDPIAVDSIVVKEDDTKYLNDKNIEPKKTPLLYTKVFSENKTVNQEKRQEKQKSVINEVKLEEVSIDRNEEVKDAPYNCHVCDHAFHSEKKLNKHILKHTKRYSCDQCDKSFPLRGTLKLHKNVHLTEKPYKCNVCGKEFTQAGNLRIHDRRYHGETEFTVGVVDADSKLDENTEEKKCAHCDEIFETTHQFNSHMISMHNL